MTRRAPRPPPPDTVTVAWFWHVDEWKVDWCGRSKSECISVLRDSGCSQLRAHRYLAYHATPPPGALRLDRLTPSVLAWLRYGERGASSLAILSHLIGIPFGRSTDAPWDPDDLRRCVQLLWCCPELIECMDEMATASKAWARLVPQWTHLVHTFLAEVQVSDGNGWPQTWALMQSLRQP